MNNELSTWHYYICNATLKAMPDDKTIGDTFGCGEDHFLLELFDITEYVYSLVEKCHARGFQQKVVAIYEIPELIADVFWEYVNSFRSVKDYDVPKPDDIKQKLNDVVNSQFNCYSPKVEYPFLAVKVTEDQFRCIGVSTAHLTEDCKQALSFATHSNMVFERDTGWIVKLYDEDKYNHEMPLTPRIKSIMKTALKAGFRMIEFDGAAQEHDYLSPFTLNGFSFDEIIEQVKRYCTKTKREDSVALIDKALAKAKTDDQFAEDFQKLLLLGSTVEYRDIFESFGDYWSGLCDHSNAVNHIDSAMHAIKRNELEEQIQFFNSLHN